jgi:HSP20 family protein
MALDPYREIQDRFNRAFGLVPARRERDEEMSLGAWIPPVDIVEDKDRISLMVELPGFKEDEISIQMEGGVLTIRGERKFEKEQEGRTYHRVERSYGQFVRTFTLPNNVDRENVHASFRNGILEIELPKREEARPRQIKVMAGEEQRGQKEIDVQQRGERQPGERQPGEGQQRSQRQPVEAQREQRGSEAQPR